jgi:hypothetical protein
MTEPGQAGGTEGQGFGPADPGTPLSSDEALGRKAVEDGAQAAGVTQDDLNRMMAQIEALQKSVARQEAQAAQAARGDASKYATALAAHLRTKSQSAYTAEQAEHFGPVLELAAQLQQHTSGDPEADPGQIPDLLDQLGRWVRQHSRRFPADLAYITELAEELADANEAEQASKAAA